MSETINLPDLEITDLFVDHAQITKAARAARSLRQAREDLANERLLKQMTKERQRPSLSFRRNQVGLSHAEARRVAEAVLGEKVRLAELPFLKYQYPNQPFIGPELPPDEQLPN